MGPRRLVTACLCLLVLLASTPTAHGQLGLEGGNVSLGKVDPGHMSTHQRTVTNSGDEPVTLTTRVDCDCGSYVRVEPEQFDLGPQQSQTLQVHVDVPADADPGIHDNRVTIVPVTESGSGGTGVAAQTLGVTFWVRTAKLYLDPPSATDEVPVRFINAFEDALDVEVNGTLTGQGIHRDVQTVTGSAAGSEQGSRTTRMLIPLPFNDDDPEGLYTVRLFATWANASSGVSGDSGPHMVEVAHGALVSLESFQATPSAAGVKMEARLASAASESLPAWVVVRLTPSAGGEPWVVQSGQVELGPGDDETVTFEWHAPETGRYTVRAQAAYTTAAGETAYSSEWPAYQFDALKTAPGSTASPTPTEGGSSGAGPIDSDSPTLLAIVALVGLGLGALIAILVNRRGGKR